MQTDMKRDALTQAQETFVEDKLEIFLAMHVIFEVTKYAYKNGLSALVENDRDGQSHFLNVLEDKEHIQIPLKQFISFGLDVASIGTDINEMDELLENRYFVCSYTGTDALIAYMYSFGIRQM